MLRYDISLVPGAIVFRQSDMAGGFAPPDPAGYLGNKDGHGCCTRCRDLFLMLRDEGQEDGAEAVCLLRTHALYRLKRVSRLWLRLGNFGDG